MRTLRAEPVEVDAAELLRSYAPDLPPTVPRDTTVLVDGEPVMIVAPFPADVAAYRAAALSYPMGTTRRAAGIRNRSGVFGYTSRSVTMQRDRCSACTSAVTHRAQHDVIAGAAHDLHSQLARLNPAETRAAAVNAAEILPAWKLGDSVWTSGVLNHTSAMPYHYDGNNLPNWSAMVCLRRGVRGGHLHLPELVLADGSPVVVECRDGDVVYFPGYRLMHGVTPLRTEGRGSYRMTAVYYSVAAFKQCGPPDQEVARSQAKRTEREDNATTDTRVLVPIADMPALPFTVAICSAGRPDGCAERTVKTLIDGGVKPSQITVYVPDQPEREAYRASLDAAVDICLAPHDPTDKSLPDGTRAAGLATARYHAVQDQYDRNPDGWCWFMDDDVEGFLRLATPNGQRRAVPIVDVANWLRVSVAEAQDAGATLVGILPSANALTMNADRTIGLSFCIGHTYAQRLTAGVVRDTEVTLCEKEDYERSILHFLHAGGSYRINDVAARSTTYAGTGGLAQSRTFERSHAEVRWLLDKYPGLIRLNAKRTLPVSQGRAEVLIQRQRVNRKITRPYIWPDT